ncbi:MAG: glucuronate isomerase [Muribaculaceae bacterium]|nr:glucuronate isomerase [Muribaculaceae bacterium]
MKFFLDDDFLLDSPTAKRLYHEHAATLPIIDYHCHLNPEMIASDHRFGSITELWLGGDHYKWRAMRANGVEERFITGTASPWEKFVKWAETMPYCFRNPLYHWTHLELKTAFGIDRRLNPESAKEIYEECNRRLREDPDMTARGLMRRYKVEVVCTTDDPVDSLAAHRRIAGSGFEIKVLPTWRPDKAMAIGNPKEFADYVARLEEVSGIAVSDFSSFEKALRNRHDFFAAMGCRLSDHGLTEFYADDYSDSEIEEIFNKAMTAGTSRGERPTEAEVRKFKSRMLVLFGVMDAEKGWAQQYHYGALRNVNSQMYAQLGPDTGYDSIGQWNVAESLARLLDRLNSLGCLPKTIIYNLDPSANEMIATMIGNFQGGARDCVPGKIQFGSGWWFNDQLDGMRYQLNALSRQGLLSRFVGMLTDSRSFLSYPRHEYFRRLLCNLIGKDVEAGLIPAGGYEGERLNRMVEDISYYNAKAYFAF